MQREKNRLLLAAGRFHGHIGPFLATGLKMGMFANEVLGRDPFSTCVEVRVEPKPPRSCTVDGIQFVTGCTMGKGNISLIPDLRGVAATFKSRDSILNVRLKADFLFEMESALEDAPEETVIDYAFRIMDTPYEGLFEVIS